MSNLINDLHDMADLLSEEEYSEDAERIRDAIEEIERLRAVIAAQGIEARSAETRSGAAEGESPVGRETDVPEELQAKATQNRDEVRV